jgi:hypothetical protein
MPSDHCVNHIQGIDIIPRRRDPMIMALVPPAGSIILIVAAVGVGVAALINARHLNQLKHHEIDPEKPKQVLS